MPLGPSVPLSRFSDNPGASPSVSILAPFVVDDEPSFNRWTSKFKIPSASLWPVLLSSRSGYLALKSFMTVIQGEILSQVLDLLDGRNVTALPAWGSGIYRKTLLYAWWLNTWCWEAIGVKDPRSLTLIATRKIIRCSSNRFTDDKFLQSTSAWLRRLLSYSSFKPTSSGCNFILLPLYSL